MTDMIWERPASMRPDFAHPAIDPSACLIEEQLERLRSAMDVRVASLRLTNGREFRADLYEGTPYSPMPQEGAFSLHTIAGGRPLFISDASVDPRFGARQPVRGPRVRLYVGVPLCLETDRPIGLLNLFDTRARTVSVKQARMVADVVRDLKSVIVRQRVATSMARLADQLSAQMATVRARVTFMARRHVAFDRAITASRIGLWECRLADEALSWTRPVYDLFGLAPGSPPDRGRTLSCYAEDSLERLNILRSRAIAERTGFSMDAKIHAADGATRWMRLNASVECEDGVAVRLFGTKQDITADIIAEAF